MSPLVVLLLLFAVGVLQDALSAQYLRFVHDNKLGAAVFLSFVITFLGYGVLVELINQMLSNGFSALMAYSLGGALGTWVGLKKKSVSQEVVEDKAAEIVICAECCSDQLVNSSQSLCQSSCAASE